MGAGRLLILAESTYKQLKLSLVTVVIANWSKEEQAQTYLCLDIKGIFCHFEISCKSGNSETELWFSVFSAALQSMHTLSIKRGSLILIGTFMDRISGA